MGGGLDAGRTSTSVSTSYSRNDVTLPVGDFTTQLLGARILYGFTPRLFLNAFLQYADTKQVSSNIRFNFTHHPLSDIYIVYNDRRDTTTGELVERALIVKVTIFLLSRENAYGDANRAASCAGSARGADRGADRHRPSPRRSYSAT